MIDSIPKFLNGVFPYAGRGLKSPAPLDASLAYTVPAARRTQLVYLRAGNTADQIVCLTLMRDGKPMRLFPIGAKSGAHIPLTVVEDLMPDTRVEVFVSAPEGSSGEVVVDLGLLEI